MNKLLKSFLCASLLFVATSALKADDCCCPATSSSTTSGCNDCCDCSCRSFFLPRSQGDNLVVQAVYRNYRYGEDCFYGDFNVSYRFQRSREACNIARSLFGSNVLTFQGSQVETRTTGALIADNFGLSPCVNNSIRFCPQIQNNIVNFELYLGLNEWCDGLYFQIDAPLANSKWSLFARNAAAATSVTTNNNCCDNSCNGCDNDCNDCDDDCCVCLPLPSSTAPFAPGCVNLLTPQTTDSNSTFPTLAEVAAANTFEGALAGLPFGAIAAADAWKYGKFNFGCDSDTKLAAVNLILGYNFWECPDWHLGIYLRASAPTGTDGDCCNVTNLFSPVIGHNFWGLGVGLSGHAELYNCDDEHFVNVYFEGYVQHLFDRCQARSFDFTGKGCLSRYMLLNIFNAQNQVTGMINAINFATRRVETQIDVAGEGQVEFVYSNDCGFSAGLGWNIYGNSCEEACSIGAPCDSTIADRTFGFRGCAGLDRLCVQVFNNAGNFIVGGNAAPQDFNVVVQANNATASNATITSCGDIDAAATATTTLPTAGNAGTVCLASCGLTNAAVPTGCDLTSTAAIVPGAAVTAFTPAGTPPTVTIGDTVYNLAVQSTTPVTFAGTDVSLLDVNSGLAGSQITNKIFGHIDYQWTDCDWTPRVYLGGEVEFASDNRCAGMSAWGVYVGAGVSF
jgi:hypothetical protein